MIQNILPASEHPIVEISPIIDFPFVFGKYKLSTSSRTKNTNLFFFSNNFSISSKRKSSFLDKSSKSSRFSKSFKLNFDYFYLIKIIL